MKDLRKLFNPQSIAVVGASNIPSKWGHGIMTGLLLSGWTGPIYPVNSKEEIIFGLPCYHSLKEIGETPELTFIMVPASVVPGVLKETAEVGCRHAVIISSNFAEVGEEGKKLQDEIVAIAEENHILFMGPNTMGFYSGQSDLLGLWAGTRISPGGLALISQSGNLGGQLFSWGDREGIGFSGFVGSGNEACLFCEDFIEYFAEDPLTKVIALYVEGIKNGERFFEVARRVSRDKPILALKRGNTDFGKQASQSHTGALTGDARVFEAVCRQAGVILADSTQGLVDIARTFLHVPVPKGNRVCVITLGGGWGVVTADACRSEGLELPQPEGETYEKINRELPEYWSHGNPADLVGDFKRSKHLNIFRAILEDENFDAIINLGIIMGEDVLNLARRNFLRLIVKAFRRPDGGPRWFVRMMRSFMKGNMQAFEVKALVRRKLTGKRRKKKKVDRTKSGVRFDAADYKLLKDDVFADHIVKLQEEYGKPIITITFHPDMRVELLKQNGLATFHIPERGVHALAKLCDRGIFLAGAEPLDQAGKDMSGLDVGNAEALSRELLRDKKGALTEEESKRLLSFYGIPVPEAVKAANAEEAVAAAEQFGYPVVVKVLSPDLLHKSDIGGVALNLGDPEAVRKAYESVLSSSRTAKPDAEINGVLVEKMLPGGLEVVTGLKQDENFGPTVLFGLGGVFVEVMEDVSHAIAPLSRKEAGNLTELIKSADVLKGVRGTSPRDLEAAADVIMRLARLGQDLKDLVREVDINPLFLFEEGRGAMAADALVVLL